MAITDAAPAPWSNTDNKHRPVNALPKAGASPGQTTEAVMLHRIQNDRNIHRTGITPWLLDAAALLGGGLALTLVITFHHVV